MKKSIILSSILFSALIIGCGSSGGDDDTVSSTADTTTTTVATSPTEVVVQRGPVLRAVVVDNKGQIAREVGNGIYEFLNTPSYPVIATGGFIDVNRDGIVDVGDINNTLLYYSQDGQSVTLVSTIAQNPDIRNYLITTFDMTNDEIDNALPDTDDKVAAVSDEVFAYCIENNISDPKTLTVDDVANLKDAILNRLNEYNQNQDRVQMETQLVQSLNLKPLDTNTVLNFVQTGRNVDNNNMQYLITSLPTYTLDTEDKEALAHMWNEEKLAHDVYLALYQLYPQLTTLYNIATQSEATHESSVQDLIAKYNLDILSPDFNGSYDPDALAAYGEGNFSIPEIQDLYNQLYDLGKTSPTDALKVGCMVEVTDINDLDKYINDGESTPDMLVVFDNLRNGSYHHYWAFDSALKLLGVSEGCCSLGDEYCKTPDEYPITTGGGLGRR